MRYQNLHSFRKHLVNAAPNHLCKVYLIGIANDYERSKVISQLLTCFPDAPDRFSAADCVLRDVLDASQSLNLLGESIVVFDEIEKLAKKELEILAQNLKAAGYLILGSRSSLSSFFDAVEKEGIVLDLLGEKPWDREKRIAEELIQLAANSKKRLKVDAVHLLLERIGSDLALLESELQKLICYIGEREEISQEDILSISQVSRTSNLWQIAEGVVWEGGEFGLIDSNAFHMLIPALRNQLHIGLTLATLIEEKRPMDEWGKFLPKLFPKTLEKRSGAAARLKSSYFQNGLKALFEAELASRSFSSQYDALLELFRARMHVVPTSQSSR